MNLEPQKLRKIKHKLFFAYMITIFFSFCNKPLVKKYYIPLGFDGNVAVIHGTSERTGKKDQKVSEYIIPQSGILFSNQIYKEGYYDIQYYQRNSRNSFDTLMVEQSSTKNTQQKGRIYFPRTLSFGKDGMKTINVTSFYVGKKSSKEINDSRIDFERQLEKIILLDSSVRQFENGQFLK